MDETTHSYSPASSYSDYTNQLFITNSKKTPTKGDSLSPGVMSEGGQTTTAGVDANTVDYDTTSERDMIDSTASSNDNDSNNTDVMSDSELKTIARINAAIAGIKTYAPPIIIPFGLVGNVLSFLVMTRKQNRQNITCLLMAILSVVDSSALILSYLFSYIIYNLGPEAVTTGMCKANVYFIVALSAASVWVLTYMTFHRACTVCRPLETRSNAFFSSITTARRIIMGMMAVVFIWYVPAILMSDTTQTGGLVLRRQCAPILSKFVYTIYVTIDVIVFPLVPFVIILASNIAIIVKMRNAAKQRRTLVQQISSSKEKADRAVTRMLLVVSFAVLVLMTPIRIRHILAHAVPYLTSTPVSAAKTGLAEVLTLHLYLLNNALNFYLYVLGGGKRFKSDLRGIFKFPNRGNRVLPIV